MQSREKLAHQKPVMFLLQASTSSASSPPIGSLLADDSCVSTDNVQNMSVMTLAEGPPAGSSSSTPLVISMSRGSSPTKRCTSSNQGEGRNAMYRVPRTFSKNLEMGSTLSTFPREMAVPVVSNFTPQPSAPQADDPMLMIKYKQLFDAGVMTQAEYKQEKQELLDLWVCRPILMSFCLCVNLPWHKRKRFISFHKPYQECISLCMFKRSDRNAGIWNDLLG